jgi:hypothetical protein
MGKPKTELIHSYTLEEGRVSGVGDVERRFREVGTTFLNPQLISRTFGTRVIVLN